ncbi:PAS domain-containing protein [Massilia sp. CMS3.1]|uniref:PAS domain-containing protein n=1 Tax=Massilia sp. CMS3.1 TaxID=3373083 RepID=UPI003EE43E9E
MPLFRRTSLPSIRSKLLTLVLASVLPIVLGCIAFLHDAWEREADHVARDAATLTRAVAAALERDLESAETAARVVAAWPTLAPGTLGQFHAQARALLRPEFPVSYFALSGADGRPLLDTRNAFGAALPSTPNQASIEAVLRRGDARVSSLYRPSPGLPFVFSSDVPVWRDGKVAYVLSSQVRPKRIADLLGAQHLPPGWVAEVIDGRGLSVARSVGGALYAGAPMNGVLASNAAARLEGTVELPDDGDGLLRHAAWLRSGEHGWIVAVTYPDDAAHELLGDTVPATLAAASGLLGLGLLLARTIGGTIARSVQGLVKPAAALGRGRPLVFAPATIRETAVVAGALQEVEGELLRYRSGLESRVADRTAELERLHARVETVYATAPVGLCFVDHDLRFVMINDYLAAINNAPALSHLGRTLPELLGEAGVAFEQPYRRVLDSGRALRDLEVAGEVPAQPGVTRYWLSSYYPVFGPAGELVGINAVVIDITERKMLEQQNRDNEELFRVLFEGSGDAQALLAYNANFVSANPAAAALFGCASVEEVLMLSPAGASPEFQPNGRRSDEMATELMRRALDEGGIGFEWVPRRRDGTNFHADVRLSSVDIGGPGMMQVTIRDISARVAADAALRASGAQLRQRERFIRTVTDNLPALVTYWDADYRLRFANRPALAWLGAGDDAAALGRRADELIPGAKMAPLRPYVQGVLGGQPQNFEAALQNAKGEPVHVWGSYLPDVDKTGRVRGFYALHADISELKRTEGRLVQALREAEGASRAKSEFLGNMSHEIRTPMNAIVGLARLLEEAPLPPRERAHVAHIRSASASLLGIVSDLLDYAATDAGQLVLEHVPLQLDATLDSIAVLNVPAARAKGLETVFAVAPDVPRLLRGDPARLEQVLLNLVGNAVRFTESGEIVVSIEVAAFSPGRVRLRFSVRDTGIGIAPSEQARLFEPFAQAMGASASASDRQLGGVGLGLSIARRLVTLMGGDLTVKSRPGRGARFDFEADFGAPEAPGPITPGTLDCALRVLVADDNRSTGAALAVQLRARGWEAVCAGGAHDALALLHGERFDFVFLDAALPGFATLDVTLPPTVLLMADPYGPAPALPGAARLALLGKPFTGTSLEAALGELRGAAPAHATGHGALAASLAGLRVLVVEDNAVNQEVAGYVLGHAGAQVTLAANGRIALDLLAASGAGFDAVLMDLQMPVMNGYDAAEAIRAMGLHRLPIIAMSANTAEDDCRRAFDAGMDDHLPKPIDVDALVATLARLTGRSAGLSTGVGTAATDALLPNMPGVDLKAALPRFKGSIAAFNALFTRFVGGAGQTLDELHAQLQGADRAGALATAHRLRGVSANLGATRLAAHALELEAALHAGDDPQAKSRLTPLRAELASLQAAARGLAPGLQASPAADVGTHALAQLLELLQNNNMRAIAAHAALAPGLGARLAASEAGELAEAVATLRFAHAALLVEAILEQQGDA